MNWNSQSNSNYILFVHKYWTKQLLKSLTSIQCHLVITQIKEITTKKVLLKVIAISKWIISDEITLEVVKIWILDLYKFNISVTKTNLTSNWIIIIIKITKDRNCKYVSIVTDLVTSFEIVKWDNVQRDITI